MGIQFTKPGAGSNSVIGKMKAEVGEALTAVGMPKTLYILALDKQPTSQWLRENGLEAPIEAHPTISMKNGGILYNFGGATTVAQTNGRMQGNFFLPKDGFTVDAATHKAFVEAKTAQAAERESVKVKKSLEPTAEDLEAGESAE